MGQKCATTPLENLENRLAHIRLAHIRHIFGRAGIYGDGTELPVSFRNAEGPLDERGGLIDGEVHRARPY